MIRTFQALRDVDPGFAEPGHHSNGADLGCEPAHPRPGGVRARARDPRRDCRDSGRRIRRLHEHAADGRAAIRQHRERRDRRTNAGGRRGAAATQNEARLAGLLRNHGQPDHRRTRPDVGRHRSGRPRGARSRRSSRASSARNPRTRSASAFAHPSTATIGARSSAWCRTSRTMRSTWMRRASCTGRRSWRTRSVSRVRDPGHRVRGPQRPHGHSDPQQRDPRSGVVGEQRRADRARAHDADLYADRSHERRSRS